MATMTTLRASISSFSHSKESRGDISETLAKLINTTTPIPSSPVSVREMRERLRWIVRIEDQWFDRYYELTELFPRTDYRPSPVPPFTNTQIAILLVLPASYLQQIGEERGVGLNLFLGDLFIIPCFLKRLLFTSTSEGVTKDDTANACQQLTRNMGNLDKEEEVKLAGWAQHASEVLFEGYFNYNADAQDSMWAKYKSFIKHFTHKNEAGEGINQCELCPLMGKILSLAGGATTLQDIADEPVYLKKGKDGEYLFPGWNFRLRQVAQLFRQTVEEDEQEEKQAEEALSMALEVSDASSEGEYDSEWDLD